MENLCKRCVLCDYNTTPVWTTVGAESTTVFHIQNRVFHRLSTIDPRLCACMLRMYSTQHMTEFSEIEQRLTELEGASTHVARFQGVHFAYAFVCKKGEMHYLTEERKRSADGQYRFNYWLLCSDGPKLIGSSLKSKFDQHIVQKRLFLTQSI